MTERQATYRVKRVDGKAEMPPLSIRIVELAAAVRESDPELCAWILAAQMREKEARRNSKRKTRKARLSGHGKAGVFWMPEEALR